MGDSDDWREVVALLPTEKTPEDKEKRVDWFNQWDPNGNGWLSLAEIDKGLAETEGLDPIFNCKPAVLRAYKAAKGVKRATHKLDDDYVTKVEFRMLMVYLKLYYGLYQIFDAIDTGDDRRVDLDEFKEAAPSLREWGVEVADDEEETFKEIDADGFGQILFIEFSEWAIEHNVIATEALADPDEDEEEEGEEGEEGEEEGDGPQIVPLSENDEYQQVAAKLPCDKTEADMKARKKLFSKWDPNGNGYLSLAEIDKGLVEMGEEMEPLAGCKPAVMRAYMAAKDVKNAKTKHDDDYVTFVEFRLLMVYLKTYFGLYTIFDAVDTGDDRRVDVNEFTAAADSLKELGVPVASDPTKTFAKADKDGHGQILFDEFCAYCTKHNALVKDAAAHPDKAPAKKKKAEPKAEAKAPKKKLEKAPSDKALKPVKHKKGSSKILVQPPMGFAPPPATFEDMPAPSHGKLVALKASERAKEIEREERAQRVAANQMAVLKSTA